MNLLKNKQFSPTFWTQFWGAFNDNFFKNALIILMTFQSLSFLGLSMAQLISLSSAIFILPFFLFSSLAANISNKYPKHLISKNLKLLELAIMILGSFGLIFHNVWLLEISLFLLGTQATLYGPVKYSILPELVHENELTESNAFIEAGTFLAILLGTISGGLLINQNNGVYLVSGLSIFFALLGYCFSRKIPVLKAVNKEEKIQYNIFSSTKDILLKSKEKTNIFMTIIAISWFWFLGAFILTILPILTKNIIHGNDGVITLFLALFSVGVALGAIFSDKVAKGKMELGLIPLGSIGMSVSLFLIYLCLNQMNFTENVNLTQFLSSPSAYSFLSSLLAFSFFGGLYSIPLYTYMQIRTTSSERSNMIASNNILNALFMVISSLMIMGFNSFSLSIPNMFLVVFGLNIAISIYTYKYMPEFMLRFLSYCVTHIIYNVKIVNKNNIPSLDKSLIITSNHVSFVDWLIISSVIDVPIRFVMHYTFYNLPLIKYLCKDAKVIRIAGKSENESYFNQAFKEIDQALSNQEIICIFPEGKITKDGSLNEFKKGLNAISASNPNVAILPIAIKNMYGSAFSRKESNSFKRAILLIKNFRREVTIEIGTPIENNTDPVVLTRDQTVKMLN